MVSKPALLDPYEDIRVEHPLEHVEVLTLDRPKARNALTRRTCDDLERAVRESTARCLVITGADPAFCSGDPKRGQTPVILGLT